MVITKMKQAFQRYKDTGRWNKGGSVNTKKKQYRTVTNRFSDRMLPGKKTNHEDILMATEPRQIAGMVEPSMGAGGPPMVDDDILRSKSL